LLNLTAFTLSNSNGLSFGLNGSVITGSYTVPNVPSQTVQTQSIIQGIYDGINSVSTGTIRVSNANGVSFGINGQTLTASVAAQSNQTAGLYAIGNSTQNSSTTLDVRSLSFNGLGAASIGYSNGSIQVSVPTQSAQTQSNVAGIYDGANSISTGTVRFSNSNGITFGINGQVITASHNGITLQSNQTAGLYAIGNSTQNSSTVLDVRSLSFNGLGAASIGYSNGSIQVSVPVQSAQTQSNIAAIYDGANSISTGTIRYSNANGVSFGVNGQTLTASVAAQTNQSIGLYAVSNTTQNSSTTLDARSLSFQGAGNVSVGYSNGSVVISATGGGGGGVGIAGGTQTATSGTVVYSNSNNITFGMSNSSIITASYNFNMSAGTTSNNLNALTFSNSNGVSFGMNGSVLTASVVPPTGANVNVSAGTTSSAIPTIVFSNLNNVSFGLNGSTITASVIPPSGANINVSAGTTSAAIPTIIFSNSNGLSFGLNGSTITGSYTTPVQTNQAVGLFGLGNTTQNSSTTLDARSLSFNAAGIITVGYSNGSIQFSATTAAQTVQTQSVIQGIYDGVNSVSTGTIRFSNANGVSFGINGQTITASINPIFNINVSAGTTSNNLTALTFSNSNNISFGLNGSVITGSFAQSNQTGGFYVSGNTTGQSSSSSIDIRSFSVNGLGAASVGYSNGSLLISSPIQTSLSYSNLNGISFGIAGSTLTASYTVPTQSVQTEGRYAIGNTIGQSSSSTFDARTLSLSAAGNISLGYSGNALVISGSQSLQTQNIVLPSAGTQTATSGTVIFANSNGISFGMSNSNQITAS